MIFFKDIQPFVRSSRDLQIQYEDKIKQMKTCHTSYLVARETITDLDANVWNRVASSNLRKIIPKHGRNFGKNAFEAFTNPTLIRPQRSKTQMSECEDNSNLKQTMLTNGVPMKQFQPRQVKSRSNSKPSTTRQTRGRRETQFTNKYFKTVGKDSSLSRNNLNTTISQTNNEKSNKKVFFQIPEPEQFQDRTVQKLREKKMEFEEKEEKKRRLEKLKEKAKKDKQMELRKKLKQNKSVWFTYEGGLQGIGDIPSKMLTPGVVPKSEVSFDVEVIQNSQIAKNESSDKKFNMHEASKQERKIARTRMTRQEEMKNQINSFLLKNQNLSHHRLFGNFFDSNEKVSKGVKIFQKETGMKRENPIVRGKFDFTRSEFKSLMSFKKFRSHEVKNTHQSQPKKKGPHLLKEENKNNSFFDGKNQETPDHAKKIKQSQYPTPAKPSPSTLTPGFPRSFNSSEKIRVTPNERLLSDLIL